MIKEEEEEAAAQFSKVLRDAGRRRRGFGA